MISYTCLICNEVFEIDDTKYKTIESAKQTLSKLVKKHIKLVHKITLKDYMLQCYFNGNNPVCKCGCGKEVDFIEKNALYDENHGFRKYYHCSHVSAYVNKNRIINSYSSKYNDKNWLIKHYDEIYGLDNIKNAIYELMNNDDYSFIDIGKKYNIDYRTLKSICLKLEFITSEQWEERSKYNKYKISSKHRKVIFNNADEICYKLYDILQTFPNKFTVSSLIDFFNKTNILQIDQSQHIIEQNLYDRYGEKIYNLLNTGYHSKEELEFIKILQFYFGKSNIKIGKKLQYGENKKQVYIYDCCICDKIILEYDSTGFWHKDKSQRDNIKEQFAIDNGYIFLRISQTKSKDETLITKIKKLLEYD